MHVPSGCHVFRLAHSIPERTVFENMTYFYNVLSRAVLGSGPDPSLFPFPARFRFWLLVLSSTKYELQASHRWPSPLFIGSVFPLIHAIPFLALLREKVPRMTACFVMDNVYQNDRTMSGRRR